MHVIHPSIYVFRDRKIFQMYNQTSLSYTFLYYFLVFLFLSSFNNLLILHIYLHFLIKIVSRTKEISHNNNDDNNLSYWFSFSSLLSSPSLLLSLSLSVLHYFVFILRSPSPPSLLYPLPLPPPSSFFLQSQETFRNYQESCQHVLAKLSSSYSLCSSSSPSIYFL